MIKSIFLAALITLVSACGSAAPRASVSNAATPQIPTVAYVYRSATCTCCHSWEEYMRTHGYAVHSVVSDDLPALKEQMGVPSAAASCHTAVIDGYVVEGHVPVEAIENLLAQRPNVDGIALPGMPSGSPGMGGAEEASLAVVAFDSGATQPYGSY